MQVVKARAEAADREQQLQAQQADRETRHAQAAAKLQQSISQLQAQVCLHSLAYSNQASCTTRKLREEVMGHSEIGTE